MQNLSNNVPFKKRVFYLFLVLTCLMLASCGDKEEDDPVPKDEATPLMERVIGNYKVDGLYDGKNLGEFTMNIRKKSATELEISGPGFQSFLIKELFVGYQNAQDKEEFTLFSETVGPDDGSVTFSFPKKEILILVEIKESSTIKKYLSLTGVGI